MNRRSGGDGPVVVVEDAEHAAGGEVVDGQAAGDGERAQGIHHLTAPVGELNGALPLEHPNR